MFSTTDYIYFQKCDFESTVSLIASLEFYSDLLLWEINAIQIHKVWLEQQAVKMYFTSMPGKIYLQ